MPSVLYGNIYFLNLQWQMEEQKMQVSIPEVTTERMGLVCRTRAEIYYFLASECMLIITSVRIVH